MPTIRPACANHALFVRLALLVLLSTGLGARAADPFAAMVRETEPLTPAEQRKTFSLPPGFDIQLVATEPDINKPMNMAFDAAGRLWVTTSIEYPFPAKDRPARDRLMIFEDFGPDGRARKVTQFADGLNIPIGIYPFRSPSSVAADVRRRTATATTNSASSPWRLPDETWKAVVWSIPNIWLLEDTDGDGQADQRTVLYGPFDVSRDTHGNQASFRRGFDGWIYATHGFNNDSWITNRDGSVVHLNSGNTYRFRLDGSKLEHHTHGQVNPFGLTWDPRGNLYSSDCHSAPIYQLLAGGYYPSFGKPDDGLGFAPVMIEHAHGSTAIDGALYYADDLWPAEYQDTFFIGNVMTSRLNRDKITFIGSTPKATEQPDFLTTTDPWFRPVDNQLGPDGALYVADFYNRIIGHYEVPLTHAGRDHERGRIWRVVYTNAAVGRASSPASSSASHLRPAALPSDLDGLIEELGSPNLTRRLLAMNEIEDRFATKALPKLGPQPWLASNVYSNWSREPELAERSGAALAFVHSLWLKHRVQRLAASELERALGAPLALVRAHVLRIAAEGMGSSQPDSWGHLGAAAAACLADPDALVRRCAAEALGAKPSPGNLRPLLQALSSSDRADTHLVYVIRKAIRDTLNVPGAFDELAKLPADQRALVADILPAVPTAEAARYILANLPQLGTDSAQIAALLQHAARYGDAESAPAIARFALDRYAADPAMQLTLIKSVRSGLDQRGAATPDAVANWGRQLAVKLLDEVGAAVSDWRAVPLEGSGEAAIPWVFQERPCADGQTARVISSLAPGGEALTGVLRSKRFSLPQTLSFYLAGHDGYPDKPLKQVNKVLLKSADGSVLREASPPRNDTARKIEWSFTDAEQGKDAFLEVVDGDTGDAYAWLAIGRIEPAVVKLPVVAPRDLSGRLMDAVQLAAASPSAAVTARLRHVAGGPLGSKEQTLVLKTLLAQDPSYAEALVPRLQPGAADVAVLATVLAETDQPLARTAVVDFLRGAPARLQSSVTLVMAGSRSGAEALLQGVASGKISGRVLGDAKLVERLLASNPEDVAARLAALTRDLPPMDDERQKRIDTRLAGLDPAKANVPHGREVFRNNCAACHRIAGEGGLVGPQLDGIGIRGAERLCEDILDPNRNVDSAFRQTLLTLKDDDVVSGLFRREEGATLVLADATGAEIKVQKSQVKARVESATSLMPDLFGEGMSSADFNDLIAWLLTQRNP
jgi:putative heme-binding domain-containing protein